MRAPLVLAALLLAGCVTPPEVTTPEGDGALAPNVIPWQLNECRYIVGWSQADPAIVQANLPEGFMVGTSGPLGLPAPGPAQRALIGTEAFECVSGAGLDGTVDGMTYASIWIPVEPPAELLDPDATAVYYKIDILVPDAPRRERMADLGLPVENGEITWDTPTNPNGFAASFSLEETGDFAFDLLAPQPTAAGEGAFFQEITPAGEDGEGGYAIWRAEFAWSGDSYSRGNGYIDWPAGHWVTEAIGSQRAPGQFHAGTWSFNGTLTLPAR